ncbi:hypothetical protein [Actinocrispum wychmicini]|uniref:Uncharacterized protein n=1 Tax=Actinocrispum wychmicini TaxID=1213861 RepID=A0A4V2S6M3_9PSEU|nr:hypothetical protein [Actinocrispum wychmicini]TCO56660.1 hypothetical protein EV192_106134 [Actinocrispum wychmicini]
MLVLVLLLVVAALGLLIAALTTANTLWAWLSVLISVVAAGLLVTDWVRTRRRRSQAALATDKAPSAAAVTAPPESAAEFTSELPPRQSLGPQISRLDLRTVSDEELDAVFNGPSAAEPITSAPVTSAPITSGPVTSAPVTLDPNVEPPEENTDATDRLVVGELTDEVVVIDEHPRYHLATCAWLGDRQTLPLAISEARDLQFTPCAHCAPDATLAASHRARS